MVFRDDLYQANRRVDRASSSLALAEQQLRQARADRDHLEGRARTREVEVPEDRPRRLPPLRHHLDLLQWWPLAAVPAIVIVWATLLVVVPDGDVDAWADFPLGVVLASAIAGSLVMSTETLLRYTRGERTIANRLLLVLAAILGSPALLCGFLVFGSVVMPVIGVLIIVIAFVHWLVTGKS